ncbi:VCBS repeat-containing protein [Alphaproteobacteria bacterium KMM 3653]|uniref:VCBS repeat-containing protein n=2 Tax=Harenicola maris TaxID=2841044 RepID=A0AAP2CSF8_9RHOB|nr:VCBS repeat-containing protein [Harenicola maris]
MPGVGGEAVARYEVPVGSRTAAQITAAWFAGPVKYYPHGVLGDAVEASVLSVRGSGISPEGADCVVTVTLGEDHVFEDLTPRLVDLDGDGAAEVVAVRSHVARGAQLAVYGMRDGAFGLIATTPYIGQRNRWLAPVGAADLDGDGAVEIAFVDRPHLAKTLRIWRWQEGDLVEVGGFAGVSNHRIGENFISGGLRDCGAGPEMVLARGDWSGLLALRFDGSEVTSTPVAGAPDAEGFGAALSCS